MVVINLTIIREMVRDKEVSEERDIMREACRTPGKSFRMARDVFVLCLYVDVWSVADQTGAQGEVAGSAKC